MSEVRINDPVSASGTNSGATTGAMSQTVTQGQRIDADGVAANGDGIYGNGEFNNSANGSSGLSADLTNVVSPDLFHDEYDRDVVRMGFSPTPLNGMLREGGSVTIKSIKFGFWSIDLRKTQTTLTQTVSALAIAQVARKTPQEVAITVDDPDIFDPTDVIIFDGVPSYESESASSTRYDFVPLSALVVSRDSSNSTIKVQFLNAKQGQIIPIDTKIYVLGHAAAEEDASTTPWLALPEPTEQFMQKFMAQSLISNVWAESVKEVNWTKQDINSTVLQQLLEDIEKFYWFGVKSYTYNVSKNVHTRTCAGIIQQMIEGGSTIIDFSNAQTFNFSDLLEGIRQTFVGNTGSSKRYMYSGSQVAPAIWGLQDLTEIVSIKEYKAFNYEFDGISAMGYHLVHVPAPLFDYMGKSNWAVVLDRAYVKRAVYRSLKDVSLELEKTGAYDGESIVWSEISAPILKYPRVHALWIFPKNGFSQGVTLGRNDKAAHGNYENAPHGTEVNNDGDATSGY